MGRCDRWMALNQTEAFLCNICGFGNKKNNCCVCDQWVPHQEFRFRANLCNQCGFGNGKDNCCKCNRWMGGQPKEAAYLCNNCGFGNKKDNCCKLKKVDLQDYYE